MLSEISRLSRKCNECGKELVVNGHWYNQLVIEHHLDCKEFLHRLIYHRDKLTRKQVRWFLRDVLIWIPLMLLQIMYWPYEAAWRILYWDWRREK